jgi:hypothetical protein
VELNITRFSMDLRGDAWKKARVGGKLTVDKIATVGDQGLASAALSQLVVEVPETSLDQTVAVNITRGELSSGAEKGTISGKVQLSGLTGGTRRYNANLNVDKLPVALAEVFNSSGLKLVDLLGPVIDKVTLAAVPNEKDPDQLTFSAKVTSKSLNSDLSGTFKSGAYATVNKSSFAQFDLDPKGFAAVKTWLAKTGAASATASRPTGIGRISTPARAPATAAVDNDTVLARTAPLRLDFDDLAIYFLPASAGGGLDAAKSRMNAHLSLPNGMAFHSDARKEDAQISKLSLDLTSSSLAERIDVAAAATANYQMTGFQPLTGPIKIANTSIMHLFDPKTGKVDTAAMVVTTDTSMAALSVGAIDALAGQNGNLLNLLGPAIENLSVKGRYDASSASSFDLAFKSTNTAAALPLSISKDMVLTMRSDAGASAASAQIVKITPDLAKMLSLANPLLGSVSGNQQPINLTLDKSSFRIPLNPFTSTDPGVRLAARKGVTLNATLNLSTLEMTHGSLTESLSQLGSLLGGGGMQKTFHAAFNPLEVHVASGIVRTNDLWLNSYDIFPGRYVGLGVKVQAADLGTDPIQGDLAVALPGLMVRQIPGTEKYISPSYAFVITKRGPLANMQIDWGGFVADMAKMSARVEAANQAQRLGGNNPLVAMGIQTAINAVMDAIPQGSKQSDIRRDWPNLPQQLPSTQPGGGATGR